MAYDSSDKPGSNELDHNPDPITGAPGSHPLGTGIGTSSGALTGAAIGAIGGPVGAAIGIIAGGIVGAIAGHKAGEYNDPTEDLSRPGEHADPVAAATNPAHTSAPATTADTAGTARPSTAAVSPAPTGTSASSTAIAGGPTPAMKARSAGLSLDQTDADYWRETHKTRTYTTPDTDFDADFAPAYGYGTEVGRQHKLAGGTAGNGIDELDADLRGGWDHVRGDSRLTYDQARPAIADAYQRHVGPSDAVPTGEVRLDDKKVSGARSAVDNVTRGAVANAPRTTQEAGTGSR